LLSWMFLVPAYYNSFDWPANTARWRYACFVWWGLLLTSAWLFFLPGLLDRFKFTDALVGHSHMAMAGFISSLNIFLLVTLLGKNNAIFNSKWAFAAWQAGTLGYVFLMVVAGWLEGGNPSFTNAPGVGRDALYLLRLECGGLMTAASCHWLLRASRPARAETTIPRDDLPSPELVMASR
jgi:cytochrome c oxidase cbb3-type subunit I